jgi:hypothetical protein
MTNYEILQALSTQIERNYIPYDDYSVSIEMSTNDNPEKRFIRKEAWEILSEEAKQLVMLVINSPADIAEALGVDEENLWMVRPPRIEKWLLGLCAVKKKKHSFVLQGDRRFVKQIIREVKIFAQSLGEIG